MKNIVKKIGLFLLCMVSVTALACCFADASSDSVQNSSVEISSESQQASNSTEKNDDSSEVTDSSSSSSTRQEDENELPRVPYK